MSMNAAGPHHHASMLMDAATMLGAIPAYVTVAMNYLEALVLVSFTPFHAWYSGLIYIDRRFMVFNH